MKIAMIGVPGTGKTIYFTGLYREYSNDIGFLPLGETTYDYLDSLGIEQRMMFEVRITNFRQRQDFADMAEMLGKDPIEDYPPKTSSLNDLNLRINFKFQDIEDGLKGRRHARSHRREFTFYDPPGETFLDNDQELSESTLYELNASDAFMIMLPCDLIVARISRSKNPLLDAERIVRDLSFDLRLGAASDMLNALRERKLYYENPIFPVCFVLTKADYLNDTVTDVVNEIIYNGLMRAFSLDNSDAVVCVAPISVIDGPNQRFEPVGLRWPFAFVAGGALLGKSHEEASDAEDYYDRARETRENAKSKSAKVWKDPWGRLEDFMRDGRTADHDRADANLYESSADDYAGNARKERELAERVWNSILTEGYHEGVRIFIQGTEINDIDELLEW